MTNAAKRLKVSRKGLYNFINNKHPEITEVIEEARESMLDNTESALYKNILAGKEASIIFALKTQGYRRGWSEKYQEVKHWRELLDERDKAVVEDFFNEAVAQLKRKKEDAPASK